MFAWFDRDIIRHEYQRPLMPHQKDLTDAGLTYHFQSVGGGNGHRQDPLGPGID